MSVKQYRYSFIGFALYVVCTIVASALVMSFWVANQAATNISQEALATLAANDDFIQLSSQLIGIGFTLLLAMLVTKLDIKHRYTSAKGLALLLTIYGVVGIVLHPVHELYRQALKLTMPILLSLLGAWIILKTSPIKAD